MPYGMNIYRRPKPAHVFDVVGIVSENLDYVTSTNGKRGYVTASVSPVNPNITKIKEKTATNRF